MSWLMFFFIFLSLSSLEISRINSFWLQVTQGGTSSNCVLNWIRLMQWKSKIAGGGWFYEHTCPSERFLALSYSSSMWAVKGWKSGMTNFLRKAWVSRTMLLWTHLHGWATTVKTLWLHAFGENKLYWILVKMKVKVDSSLHTDGRFHCVHSTLYTNWRLHILALKWHFSTLPTLNGKNFQWGFISTGCSATISFSLTVAGRGLLRGRSHCLATVVGRSHRPLHGCRGRC